MSDSQKGTCVGLGVAFLILPVVAVGARVWACQLREKKLHTSRLHVDDYLIFVALVFAEATGAAMLWAAEHGNLGQRLTYTYSPEIPDQIDELVVFLKTEYALSLFAQLAILSAKLSLLALYRRIFYVMDSFRRNVLIVGAIVVVWHTVFMLLFILQCIPVQATWNLEMAATAKCLNKLNVWEAYAISDVLTDALVLSLPIPAVLSLHMSARKKLGVSLIFLLGAIVIATGIARTVFFFIIAKESLAQITYNSAPCMYWSFIETSLAVVGACLPTLRPLVGSEGNGVLVSRLRGFMSLLSTNRSNASRTEISSNHSTENLKPRIYVSKHIAMEDM